MVLFLNYLSDPLAAIRLLSLISEHRSKMAEDTDVRALLESYAVRSNLNTIDYQLSVLFTLWNI